MMYNSKLLNDQTVIGSHGAHIGKKSYITNGLRWKSFAVFVDPSLNTKFSSELAIMPLYNRVWPHKTTMQSRMFSSKI